MAYPQSFYKLIVFGESEYGFWNEPNIYRTPELAITTGQNCIGGKDVAGFVVVEVTHEDWRVLYETSTMPISVSCNHLGSIKVSRAPKLVMV